MLLPLGFCETAKSLKDLHHGKDEEVSRATGVRKLQSQLWWQCFPEIRVNREVRDIQYFKSNIS
jgi:hypothetical protein